MILFYFFIIQVFLDALEDSLNTKIKVYSSVKHNKIRHIVQAFHVFLWLSLVCTLITYRLDYFKMPLYILGLNVIGAYTLVRFALFDYLYNIFTGRPRTYYGQSSYYDILLNLICKAFSKSEIFVGWIVLVLRIVCIFSAYNILLSLLK